jgi:hypothetical protein
MMHAFYPSTQEAETEAGESLIFRSALSTGSFRTATATKKPCPQGEKKKTKQNPGKCWRGGPCL